MNFFHKSRTNSRSNRVRPIVEPLDGRELPAPMVAGHLTPHVNAAQVSFAQRLARYRVFEGSILVGPQKGVSFVGPIVVFQTDARGQVFASIFTQDRGQLAAVGLVFGGSVSLRLTVPRLGHVEIVGSGTLQRVPGGLPAELALVGTGRLEGPLNSDVGTWKTVKPSL